MPAVPLIVGGNATWPTTGSFFFPVAIGPLLAIAGGGDLDTRVPWRAAGTFRRLQVRITSSNGAGFVRFRKNGLNGNQAITWSAGASGTFEDVSNADSIVAGDLCNIQVRLDTGSSLGVSLLHAEWEPQADMPVRLYAYVDLFSTASATRYITVCGYMDLSPGGTEAHVALSMRTAATVRNAAIYVNANTRTTTTTFAVRKDGADTTIVLNIAGGATGLFENTADTASVASGNELTWRVTTGTGTGSIGASQLSVEYVTSDGSTEWINGKDGATLNQNQTKWIPFAGRLFTWGDESSPNVTTRESVVLLRLRAYVSANTLNVTCSVRTRRNGTDGTQLLSIAGGTTGWFEDTSGKDVFSDGDNGHLQLAVPAGSGSITFYSTLLTVLQAETPTVAAIGASTDTDQIVGVDAATANFVGAAAGDAPLLSRDTAMLGETVAPVVAEGIVDVQTPMGIVSAATTIEVRNVDALMAESALVPSAVESTTSIDEPTFASAGIPAGDAPITVQDSPTAGITLALTAAEGIVGPQDLTEPLAVAVTIETLGVATDITTAETAFTLVVSDTETGGERSEAVIISASPNTAHAAGTENITTSGSGDVISTSSATISESLIPGASLVPTVVSAATLHVLTEAATAATAPDLLTCGDALPISVSGTVDAADELAVRPTSGIEVLVMARVRVVHVSPRGDP